MGTDCVVIGTTVFSNSGGCPYGRARRHPAATWSFVLPVHLSSRRSKSDKNWATHRVLCNLQHQSTHPVLQSEVWWMHRSVAVPNRPPKSLSRKPLYQWLSFPSVAWHRLSICVATLSFIKSAHTMPGRILPIGRDKRVVRLTLGTFRRAEGHDFSRTVTGPLV